MKTEIIAITDKSGSIGSILSDVMEGYNAFLKDQRKVEGEARVTHVLFNGKVETPLDQAVSLKEATELTYQNFIPGGSTALRDAIGMTLEIQAQRITKEKWADLVIVFISTDGEENASKEYSTERIKQLIEHCEKHGWKFIFAAANQDAFHTGGSLGISRAHTMNYTADAAGTQTMYKTASISAQSMRSGIDPAACNLPIGPADTGVTLAETLQAAAQAGVNAAGANIPIP